MRCHLTDLNGVIQSTDLKLDGDWIWKEQFNPQIPGQWTFELDSPTSSTSVGNGNIQSKSLTPV